MGLVVCVQSPAFAAMPLGDMEQLQKTEAGGETDSALRLWYDEPAPIESSDVRWWQSSALPIGNSSIGGMIFGAVERDRIHINEKTLWTGGPKNGEDKSGDGNPYRGGNRLTYAGDKREHN